MFKKILIATDLSASSDAIVNCMADLRSLDVEEIILFYACGVRHITALAENIKQSVESDLLRQQKKLEEQGFKTILEIAPGVPSEELKRVCKEKEISLVIIGSHGESMASHKLFRYGGVTSEILHSHECPLLLIRTRIIEEKGIKTIETTCRNLNERILFATDFSDISIRAFLYVEQLVEAGCKKVTLIHVQDKVKLEKYLSDKLEEFNKIDSERLEMHKQQLLRKGAEEVEVKISYGVPAQEILKESKNGYSLIVMGSQGRGFFNEVFIGSVSHNVSRHADISTLLVPRKNR